MRAATSPGQGARRHHEARPPTPENPPRCDESGESEDEQLISILEQALEAIGAERRAKLYVQEADERVNVVWKELESASLILAKLRKIPPEERNSRWEIEVNFQERSVKHLTDLHDEKANKAVKARQKYEEAKREAGKYYLL